MAGDELLETGLPDRDPALLEALDLGRVDVDAPDIVAELGEAGGGHEADVSGADDPDRFSLGTAHSRRLTLLLESLERGGDLDHLGLADRRA